MTSNRLCKGSSRLLLGFLFATSAQAAQTDISTVPLETYSAPSSTDVKPNVLFVLDDSGSMQWDFMPDWACSSNYSHQLNPYTCNSAGQNALSADEEYLFRNAAYNGIYYNPAISYQPPIHVSSAGAADTTTYPSQTGLTTATGAGTGTTPNWKAVKDDAYGVVHIDSSSSPYKSNLIWDPSGATTTIPSYFYTVIPGEYCATTALRVCVAQTAPSTTYPYPATIRWCNSAALTNCKAGFDATYAYVRMPSPTLSIFTVAGSRNVQVSAVTVSGTNIMSSGSTTASTNPITVAAAIASKINAAFATNGGYGAYASGAVVTIAAPYPATITALPAISSNCPSSCSINIAMTFTGTGMTFARQGNNAAEKAVPGASLMTMITSERTSYTYPNTAAKGANRTDCSGTTCTYAEAMTNFANWWTYYRTRVQMMKTAASNAFSQIDSATDIANGRSRFRLGYMSINNNTNSDFLNLGEFTGTQKGSWYTKLISAYPNNSTPLVPALSTAGQLFAGVLNGANLNGSTVTDPLQYSCQQNYTILSTDGFWNTGSSSKLDQSTAVGNQDAGLPRPLYDGGSATTQARTSTLQQRTITIQPQSSTSNLQSRAGPLQTRTSSNYGSSWTSWSNTSSCVWDTSGANLRSCQYNWGAWTNAGTCNKSFSTGTSGTWSGDGTDCQYTAWTTPANTASCTPVAQSSGPNFTVPQAVQCTTVTTNGAWTNTASCTASATLGCLPYTGWTSWSNVASCTPVAQSTGPNYTVGVATDCQIVTSGGTSNTLSDVAAYYYGTDLRDPNVAAGTGTCTGPIISPNTVANDLCANNVPSNGRDVATAQHMTTFTLGLGAQGQMVFDPGPPDYWNQTSGDFYDVKVGTTTNTASGICSWQASGACNWPTPASGTITTVDDLWHAAIDGRGSYFSAKDPTSLADALASTLSTIANVPTPGTAAAAATSNPNISSSDNFVFSSSYKSVQWYGEMIRQQIDASGNLSAQQWSAMQLLDCATTSWTANTGYLAGSVYKNGTTCYTVTTAYSSGATYGGADTSNTSVVAGAPITRTIYTKSSSANSLIPFLWTSLSGTQQGYFTAPAITYVAGPPSTGLSQFCTSGAGCLSGGAQSNNTIATGGAAGEALVNFLRGDRTNESIFYRQRTHVLGDIVSSEARYVQTPVFKYGDAGYGDFKIAKVTRSGTVYVGANDGMLHAFDAATGQENWAYIPSLVLPNLYQLADNNYSGQHQYFVDNTPEVGDFCPNAPGSACTSSQWKTILVGGLNRGGKGYYALDITNPASPTLLWEFTDVNLGYSFGNPVITKLHDGTWVVMFSSGYNNNANGGDGTGRLYILNANTGTLIRSIANATGDTTTPSGLGGIAGHALSPQVDNSSIAVYGGDLLGNLWRFDINGNIGAAGFDAQLLASFKDASNNAQSIQAEPTVINLNGITIVFAGTGRFLGTTDVANVQNQSFYAVKDNMGSTTYGAIRTAATGFVQQTLTSGTCPNTTPANTFCVSGQAVRTSSSNAVDWATQNGWYTDFVTGGERSTTNPSLQLGTLLFTTITPQSGSANACGNANGTADSFVYALDYSTGGAVQGSGGVSGVSLGSGFATAPVFIELANGSVSTLIRVSDGSGGGTDMGSTRRQNPPVHPPGASVLRRVSWRELPT